MNTLFKIVRGNIIISNYVLSKKKNMLLEIVNFV